MGKYFTFREITEKEELEEIFKLRYEIYRSCGLNFCTKENDFHIDVDEFDVHSRHFALNCGELTVGYFRVVLPKDELTNTVVLEIGKKYQMLDEEEYFNKNGKAPFPFLSYEGIPQSHLNYFNKVQSKKERIAEASRLILHQNFRSIFLAKFLVECAMALFVLICIGKKHAVISCRSEHGKFYEHYGFIPFENGKEYILDKTTASSLFLSLSLSLSDSNVPKHLHPKLESMAQEFLTTSKMEREI